MKNEKLVYWEIRKTLSPFILLITLILLISEFVMCRYLFIGSYEDIDGNIYKNYLDTLSTLSRAEQSDFIEREKAYISQIFSEKQTKRYDYMNDVISADEYSDYLLQYNICEANYPTFDVLYQKYMLMKERPEISFTYDLELNGYLSASTADFPLILCLIILCSGFFIKEKETQNDAAVLTSRNGRRRTFNAKLKTCLAFGSIMIILFNSVGLAVMLLQDNGDISVSIQSLADFTECKLNISCLEFVVLFFNIKIISEFFVLALLFAFSLICTGYVSYYSLSSAITILPAVFVNNIPDTAKIIFLESSLSPAKTLQHLNFDFLLAHFALWLLITGVIYAVLIRRSPYFKA